MAVFLLLLIFIGVFYLTTQWYQQFKFNRRLAAFPGPTPLPVIGNVLLFKSHTDIIPVAEKLRKQFGGLFKIYLGPRPRLIICEQKSAEFLLSSSTIIEKSYEYSFLHNWLGTGLLTSSGHKWKTQRKLITPTFHFQILENFIAIFNNQSNILVEKLEKKVNEGSFDIFPYIALCTLDIICEAAMGTQINAQNNSNAGYVMNVKEMCNIIAERTLSPLKMINIIYKLTSTYQKEKKALSVIHGFSNTVIKERKKELIKKNVLIGNNDKSVKKRPVFLDLLLQCTVNGEPLSDETIREEVDTFMFEGHDTTGTCISFALYCLSHNAEIQQNVVDEINAIFADDKQRLPTYNDLQEMKYLEMVIKETLRLYPSVPIFARILKEDFQYCDKILPKGLVLTVFAVLLHRDPDVFPDPEKFDPERFSPENSKNRSPYAYVPFSAGFRNCIGQRFAMLELKCTISKVLRNFEILPVPGHAPLLAVDAILKSANGLPVRLKKRNN